MGNDLLDWVQGLIRTYVYVVPSPQPGKDSSLNMPDRKGPRMHSPREEVNRAPPEREGGLANTDTHYPPFSKIWAEPDG